jgi:hypothetical protein
MMKAPTLKIMLIEMSLTSFLAANVGICFGVESYDFCGFFIGISAYWFQQMYTVRRDAEALMRKRKEWKRKKEEDDE